MWCAKCDCELKEDQHGFAIEFVRCFTIGNYGSKFDPIHPTGNGDIKFEFGICDDCIENVNGRFLKISTKTSTSILDEGKIQDMIKQVKD